MGATHSTENKDSVASLSGEEAQLATFLQNLLSLRTFTSE
jgi:hypothetical protein